MVSLHIATKFSRLSIGYCFKFQDRRHTGHTLEPISDTEYKEEVEGTDYKDIPCHGTQTELTKESNKGAEE
jgi:hypothetical protein